MKKKKIVFYVCSIVLTIVFGVTIGLKNSNAAELLNTTLKTGSRGNNVTILQTFLAKNSQIYPAGLVSGYFGTLTKSAVIQFQLASNLTADGVVGPNTRAKINSYLSTNSGPDFTSPKISGDSIQASTNSATITWTTDKNALGKVYYNTAPLVGGDDETQSYGFSLSGTVVADNGNTTTHTVTIPNLTSHTTYYYDIVSIDANGNATVTMKNTFTTN
jgi:peptidoglycan hydrolase-like protein with peptidoglycan-binding domain